MKNLLPLLLLLVSFAAFSQKKAKIKIKKGIVTVNKVPFAKMDIEKKFITEVHKSTISSLEDEPLIHTELITTDFKTRKKYTYSKWTFPQTNDVVELSDKDLVSIKKRIIKKILEHELFEDGKINSDALNKFKEAYSVSLTEKYEAEKADDLAMFEKLSIVPERDKKAKITVGEKGIYQDKVLLGYWKAVDAPFGAGKSIQIYNPDMVLVASHVPETLAGAGTTHKLLTIRDYHNRNINDDLAKLRNAKLSSKAWAIVKILVKGNYL